MHLLFIGQYQYSNIVLKLRLVTLETAVSTHMLMWSLMRSHTIRLLLSLAKYMAVFLCLDRMLQSAPYSSRRRTMSAFPLLHAWSEAQETFTNTTSHVKILPLQIPLDKKPGDTYIIIMVYRTAGWGPALPSSAPSPRLVSGRWQRSPPPAG